MNGRRGDHFAVIFAGYFNVLSIWWNGRWATDRMGL
jgi:hypothetical protein